MSAKIASSAVARKTSISAVSASAVAVARHQLARDVADIFALVAVLGHRGRAADLFEVARAHGLAEQLHLASAVVEVVLARDAEAARLVHAGERVAEHGVAPVADGERPGRIG